MLRLLKRRKPPVAWVLSGGGPLGAVQVGLIRALFYEGLVPDLIVGASVGALNGAAVAADPTPRGAERLSEIWASLTTEDLYPEGRIHSAWHAVRNGPALFSNEGLRSVVERCVGVATFEELKIPLQVLGTDLQNGDEKWFSSGELMQPLLASTALPGAYPPVKIDGVDYVDGGISNNVPVSRAVELGADPIYVLNVTGATQKRDLHRPHDYLMHGMVLARSQRYRVEIEQLRDKATIIEFPHVSVGHVGLTNMSASDRLIDAGLQGGLLFLRRPQAAGANPASS